MQEHVNLSVEIDDLLKDGRQLSISGITRELKKRGINEHRLIVTGYLRAMNDLNRLNEFDLSPSKIYTLIPGEYKKSLVPETPAEDLQEIAFETETVEDDNSFDKTDFGAEKERETEKIKSETESDIYRMVGAKISHLASFAVRFETAVYLYTTLFERPCFESELVATGLDAHQIARYFGGKELLVVKVKNDKKYADEFSEIANGTSAYELPAEKIDAGILIRTVKILNAILKDEVDVSKLAAKTSTKSLLDF
ncbi:hypothetical protein [Methanolapillus millepedarum]